MQLDNWVSPFIAQSNRKLGSGNLESGHQAPRFVTDRVTSSGRVEHSGYLGR
jgi:hypothetical protein